MRKPTYNSLIAFLGGICGFTISTILSFPVFKFITLFTSPLFFLSLPGFIFNSVWEEGFKFLPIKKWGIGKWPYGILFGFSWGGTEMFLHFITGRFQSFSPDEIAISINAGLTLHIITAGLISYFIYKKKPILGLLIAIIIHTGFNFLVSQNI